MDQDYTQPFQLFDADLLRSKLATRELAMLDLLEEGDPFPLVRFEWPELIITDMEERAEFAKHLERKDNLDLRLDDFQVDAIRSVFDNRHTQLFISGATKLGKGFTVGGLIVNIWFERFTNCKIILIGPNNGHVRDNLFGEAKTWRLRMSSYKMGISQVDVQKERIEEIGKDSHFIKIVNTESGEGLSGYHSYDELNNAPCTLICVDEGCVDDKTEFLSQHGWKLMKDFEEGDLAWTMDPDTRIGFFEKPESYHVSDYKGKMIQCCARGVDICVTPNHRIPIYKLKSGRHCFIDAEKLAIANQGDKTACTFSVDRPCVGEFTLPEIRTERKLFPEMKIKMDRWLEFLGWFVSEGSLGFANGQRVVPYVVNISQRKPENIKRIAECLNEIGFKHRYQSAGQFVICSAQLAGWLMRETGRGSINIRVPRFVFDLSSRQVSVFLDSFLLGDGYKNKERNVYYTSSKGLADDIQILCLLRGRRVTVKSRGGVGKVSWILDHFATTRHECFVVTESDPSPVKWAGRAKDIKSIDYDGKIFCFTMSSHGVFLIRRNGKCVWTGNSGCPENYYNDALSQVRFFIAISNPRAPSGWFYRAFSANKTFESGIITQNSSTGPRRLQSIGLMHCVNVKANRLSNRISPPKGIEVRGRKFAPGEFIPDEFTKDIKPLIPGQGTLDIFQSVEETKDREWRAYGRFPKTGSEFEIYGSAWPRILGNKWTEKESLITAMAVGVDVGASKRGDPSCFVFGNTVGVKEIVLEKIQNQAELQGAFAEICLARGLRIYEGMVPIGIDYTGVGKGLSDNLEKDGAWVIKVEFGAAAERDKMQYMNRRAEICGEFADAIDPEMNLTPWLIPNDSYAAPLWEELFAHEKVFTGKPGQYRLNDKRKKPTQKSVAALDNRQSVEEKIGRSPDRADAKWLLFQAIRELPEFGDNLVRQFDPAMEVKDVYRDKQSNLVQILYWSGKEETISDEMYEAKFGKDFQSLGSINWAEELRKSVIAR